jgi:predicted DNA-binding protein (MmcQ/YjbR family)
MDEAQLEALVGTWPGVTSDIRWHDDRVYWVAGKMFLVYCFQGANAAQISFKVVHERFLELTDRHGVIPAPYMARAHWVSVLASSAMSREELVGLVRGSYELVRSKLTRKVQMGLVGD